MLHRLACQAARQAIDEIFRHRPVRGQLSPGDGQQARRLLENGMFPGQIVGSGITLALAEQRPEPSPGRDHVASGHAGKSLATVARM